MKKLKIIAGTRPEAIKLAPIAVELSKHSDVSFEWIATGQHGKMHDEVLAFFGVETSKRLSIDYDGAHLSNLVHQLYRELGNEFASENEKFGVIVQGDTTSAMCAANAAFLHRVPCFHVEAGLRTNDIYSPYPEEFNRRAISLTADLHFTPTAAATSSLLSEGILKSKIVETGNTVVDAIQLAMPIVQEDPEKVVTLPDGLGLSVLDGLDFVLATFHRRENFGDGVRQFASAILSFVDETNCSVVLPVHKNPNIFGPMTDLLGGVENVFLVDTLDYPTMVFLMSKCKFIVSDSGGVQEEAPSVEKRVLVLRDSTERQEAVESGWAELVKVDAHVILNKMIAELERPKIVSARNPFGEGDAAIKIAEAIKRFANE